MTLLGIGPGELLLIIVLALIIFGPNRLPEVARTIGKTINDFRKTSEEVTSAVARELDLSEAAGSDKPAAGPQAAIRPVHDIPLSKVGEVVVTDAPAAHDAPPQTAEGNATQGSETPDEGGAKQHD